MHREILTPEQNELLKIVKLFKRNYYLVGGTAIALHIGHRYSIDFDLFTFKPISKKNIKQNLDSIPKLSRTLIWENQEQIHFNINGIKFTFYQYPYQIESPEKFENIISIPTLLDLAAMKALALGGRAKWKDYVDLSFLLKDYYTVSQISERAIQLFGLGNFSPKLFKEQLSFFKDINYSEPVIFLSGFEKSEEEIKGILLNAGTEKF